jgi:hypothetical protein
MRLQQAVKEAGYVHANNCFLFIVQLYVKGFAAGTSSVMLSQYFEQRGMPAVDVDLNSKFAISQFYHAYLLRGFAFVQFADEATAARALQLSGEHMTIERSEF